MRINEYGVPFFFNASFALGGFTQLMLKFTKPSGTILEVQNPEVEVGLVDVSTAIGTFLAGQYAMYTFVDGDVDESGVWSSQLIYKDGSPPNDRKLISRPGSFHVDP